MQNEKSKDIEDIQFWERMEFLIGDERPFPWSERIGLNRSAFQSARARGKRPLPKTVRKWAEQIGCNFEWLNKGIGEPFSLRLVKSRLQSLHKDQANPAHYDTDVEVPKVERKPYVPKSIDKHLLTQAIETAEKALEIANGTMAPENKAEFISTLYFNQNLCDNDEKLFRACVTLIEKALKDTRRILSPEPKSELIIVIYNFYYDKEWTEEHLKSALDQLIRSVS
ncbi:hypothetical protein N5B96_03155 [Acinetobacter johnsonii]|uniref:hypothetical protein n=1 Tax=Acinetobacter johnsonii TaxID=40214 RepID=UPI00244C0D2A|nr:hypothetical protein [Acinetobacter johnsonii]MDH1068498.1 hypothetical protein [Acinetobacter johnsonii]